LRTVSVLVAVLLAATPLWAESDPAPSHPSPGWEFSLAPYLWAISIDSTLEADGTTADAHLSFSDILSDLDFAGLVAFEARRGRLSLVSNLNYLKLGVEESRAIGSAIPVAPPGSLDVDVDMQTLIFEQYALFEVFSTPLGGEGESKRLALEVGPAFRVAWLDSEIDVRVKPGAPIGPFSRSFDDSTDWIDAVAAARVRADLGEKCRLVLMGDYGGFDIGSSSHRTWSLGAWLGYELGEHWDLVSGWRHLEFEQSAADLEIDGPLIGAVYHF